MNLSNYFPHSQIRSKYPLGPQVDRYFCISHKRWRFFALSFQHELYVKVNEGQDQETSKTERITPLTHSTRLLNTRAVLGVGRQASRCEVWGLAKYLSLSEQLPRHQWELVRPPTDRIWPFTGDSSCCSRMKARGRVWSLKPSGPFIPGPESSPF